MNEKQQLAYSYVTQGRNTFITGRGGTGKSYLVKQIINYCQTNNIDYVITASTGVAATLINGQTFHSFTYPINKFGPSNPFDLNRVTYTYKQWIKQLDLILIDEISMMSASYMEKMSKYISEIRNNDKPFGGIQLVVIGDFFQLPPVRSEYLFKTPIWKKFNFVNVLLTVNVRQQDNSQWDRILQNIRLGRLTEDDKLVLNQRLKPCNFVDIVPTKLYSTRKAAYDYNITQIKKLPNISQYNYSIQPHWASNNTITSVFEKIQAEKKLYIAPNAQVMLTKNINIELGLCNGSRGIVLENTKDYIKVQFLNRTVNIEREIFECKIGKTTYYVNQFPLILAWAHTIHKCQGMTMDLVEVNLNNVFEKSMVYVALSRVKDLNSLYINSIDWTKIKVDKDVIDFYQSLS